MSERPQHELSRLHLRAPRRVVGVGGEGESIAGIVGNRTGLLALRDLIDRALLADEGMATIGYGYREVDERRYDVVAQRADSREPDRPDYSMFT